MSEFTRGKQALGRWQIKICALSNHKEGFTAIMVIHEARRAFESAGVEFTGTPDDQPGCAASRNEALLARASNDCSKRHHRIRHSAPARRSRGRVLVICAVARHRL
jgi:hypothetical protein